MTKAAFLFLAVFFCFSSTAEEEGAIECEEGMAAKVGSTCTGMGSEFNPAMMQMAQPMNPSDNPKLNKAASTIQKMNAGLQGGVGAMATVVGTKCLAAVSSCKSACNKKIDDCEECKESGSAGCGNCPVTPPPSGGNCDGPCQKKADERIGEYNKVITACAAHSGKGIAALAQGVTSMGAAALSMYAANLLGRPPEKKDDDDPDEEEEEDDPLGSQAQRNPIAVTAGASGQSLGPAGEPQKENFDSGSFASFQGGATEAAGKAAAKAEKEEEGEEKDGQPSARKLAGLRGANLSGGSSSGGASGSSGGSGGSKAGFASARLNKSDAAAEGEDDGSGYRPRGSAKGASFAGGSSSAGGGYGGPGLGGGGERLGFGGKKRGNFESGDRDLASMKRKLASQAGRHDNIFERASRLIQAFCMEGDERCE